MHARAQAGQAAEILLSGAGLISPSHYEGAAVSSHSPIFCRSVQSEPILVY